MNTSNGNESLGRALLLGVLSILSPWAGYCVYLSITANSGGPPETGGWGGFVFFMTIMPLAVLIGVIAGFIGLVHAERFRRFHILPILGLLENVGLVLWWLSRVSHR